MRITKKTVEGRFRELCLTLGVEIAESYNQVGAWRLDSYNGWNIEEIISDKGAITHPFGPTRYSNREIYDLINFTLRAIEIDRTGTDSYRYWPAYKDTHLAIVNS